MSMQVFDRRPVAGRRAAGRGQSGSDPEERIDEAVRRILTLKFKLGLFDQPCVNASKADAARRTRP